MLPQEIIRKKRDKETLTTDDIQQFITGVTDQTVGEGQIAAFCMATLLNGMNIEERVTLTMAMAGSGETMDWTEESLDGPVLDKHSTGGVGDKVSLMLAPIVAACGAYVPMISGRGLGHTGGTLDKMDSIPGYVSQPALETFKAVTKNVGCAIGGATHDLAPADRRIYATRDVTATVESLDLITASILSKKLAAGLEGLVMDVKYGSGAFMATYDDAKELAENLVSVANGAGLPCTALMTDMNQVLGHTAGNAIEMRESVEFLRGEAIDERLYEIVIGLAAEMLLLGGLADTAEEALEIAAKNHKNGRAADFFGRMVMDMGGPGDLVENFDAHLVLAPHMREVRSRESGVVRSLDTRQIGVAVIELGGGRRLATDTIDHSVGLSAIAAPGDIVGPADKPLAVIFGQDEGKMDKAEQLIESAFTLAPSGTQIEERQVIRERITN